MRSGTRFLKTPSALDGMLDRFLNLFLWVAVHFMADALRPLIGTF